MDTENTSEHFTLYFDYLEKKKKPVFNFVRCTTYY